MNVKCIQHRGTERERERENDGVLNIARSYEDKSGVKIGSASIKRRAVPNSSRDE